MVDMLSEKKAIVKSNGYSSFRAEEMFLILELSLEMRTILCLA